MPLNWEAPMASTSILSFSAQGVFPTVSPHVLLQVTRRGASKVALVTLEWLFSCMLPHHVNFQITSLNAGILAHCASVRLFPRMGPFVPLQMV